MAIKDIHMSPYISECELELDVSDADMSFNLDLDALIGAVLSDLGDDEDFRKELYKWLKDQAENQYYDEKVFNEEGQLQLFLHQLKAVLE